MHVLLIDSVPLTYGGGYESFLLDLARYARERGHNVTLVTPSVELARIIGAPLGVTVNPRLASEELSRRAGEATIVAGGLLTLRKYLRWADVAYVKNEPHELLATLIARHQTRVVVGFHSAMWGRPGFSGAMRERVYSSRLYRLLLSRLDAFHVLQPEQSQFLMEQVHLPNESVHCIPNGVDLVDFIPGTETHGTRLRLLFVGRLDEQKGIDTLLNSLALLPDSSWVDLTIAGDGPLRQAAEEAARRFEWVTYIGNCSEMPELYRRHDLLVAPSRWEVFPLVPAEALASGVPVIVSSIPQNRLYEGEDAVEFCAPDDPHALAAAITKSIERWNDPKQSHDGVRIRARNYAERELDQRSSMTRLLNMMEDLLAT